MTWSKCETCEYYDSDFDELRNEETEWCEKGHDGLKGFPFKNQSKCYKDASWRHIK